MFNYNYAILQSVDVVSLLVIQLLIHLFILLFHYYFVLLPLVFSVVLKCPSLVFLYVYMSSQ